MEHIRIATYEVEPDAFESIASVAHSELLRTYEEQPGFVRQSLVRLEEVSFLSLTVWRTEDQADRAIVVAERWTRGSDSGAMNFDPVPIRRRGPISVPTAM